ncbi:hypothetical protein SHIRM173S_08316 [Streptomyces hirsutus]
MDTGDELLKRLEDLPGFGRQKTRTPLTRFHFLPLSDTFFPVSYSAAMAAPGNVWAGRLSV